MTTMPLTAAWRHIDARDGFESTRFARGGAGMVIDGATSAVEDGEVWAVRYTLVVDEVWRTRRAVVAGLSAHSTHKVVIDGDGDGRWRVDGRAAPELDGCLDVDLEASACTNTLPIHRPLGRPADAGHADRAEATVRCPRTSVADSGFDL